MSLTHDREAALWRLKRQLKSLKELRGEGTSVISLLVPASLDLHHILRQLSDETAASNRIKSRKNRQSVQDALAAATHQIKLAKKTPPNGLAVFVGNVAVEGTDKTKLFTLSLEPPFPIKRRIYSCGATFDLVDLEASLKTLSYGDTNTGFIVIDGHSATIARVEGDTQTILRRVPVTLPNKQDRGGQSALRFSRLREEARQRYVKNIAELARNCFITSSDTPNIRGLVLAGLADLKVDLRKHLVRFDPRLAKTIIAEVDTSYGGKNGLRQAIQLAAKTLGDLKLLKERQVLEEFFGRISRDTGDYAFGCVDVEYALMEGAASKILLWADSPTMRHTLTPARVLYTEGPLNPEDLPEGHRLEESVQMAEWLVDNAPKHGAVVELVGGATGEGTQFVTGFGGLAVILRYRISLPSEEAEDEFDMAEFDTDDEVDPFGDEPTLSSRAGAGAGSGSSSPSSNDFDWDDDDV